MATFVEFHEELDQLFGFYFDADMAFSMTKKYLTEIQQKQKISDSSTFMFGDGEPPGPPDQAILASLHSTTLGALKQRMSKNLSDSQRAAQAVLVFTFHIWEEKYRNSLVDKNGIALGTLDSDIMGDLRLIRNCIIHNKAIADNGVSRCKVIKHFLPGASIILTDAIMFEVIRAIRDEFSKWA
ncbi:MAG: hypothetical protein KDI63_16055 [Gammaproteobacteria bacterium]|nr:hypothetical protein [Gammaproteobacteria bacterium]